MPKKAKPKDRRSQASKIKVDSEYLPEVYEKFRKSYPEISNGFDALAQLCQRAGPLSKKISELIKLGIAIGSNSEGAVRSHTRRAIEEGNSPDEIRHVVLLAFTTNGFPRTIAGFKWVEEVLAKAK